MTHNLYAKLGLSIFQVMFIYIHKLTFALIVNRVSEVTINTLTTALTCVAFPTLALTTRTAFNTFTAWFYENFEESK